MALSAFAPAKINLYLHVVGRRADGYHLLDSLIAFADIGDNLTAAPADKLSLSIDGPEAEGLAGLGEDNLVLRAAHLLAAEAGGSTGEGRGHGAALHLQKRLPASAGIGGGSSDAAASLRVLDRLWELDTPRDRLAAIALQLGADIPACLLGRPVWVGGIGEQLDPATKLPPAGIVLANPRRPLPTAAVFRARRGAFGENGRFAAMPADSAGLAAILAARRNDLTEAALAIVPEIGSVLARLAQLPGALLARMSGSGATCFALFADRDAAVAAGRRLAQAEPGWWSAAVSLMSRPADLEAGRDQPAD